MVLENALTETRELRTKLEECERLLRDKDAEIRRWAAAQEQLKERLRPNATSSFASSSEGVSIAGHEATATNHASEGMCIAKST